MLPTYNRLNQLQRVLAGLECQSFPLSEFEVVVIADGCSDGTVEYLSSLETPLQIVFIASENRGVAAARNRGIKEATGDFIVFVDDDVVPSPQLISEHMRSHAAESDDVAVLGPLLSPPDFTMSPWVRWEQAMLYKQYHEMQTGQWQPTARQFYTGNASIVRRFLVEAGGFDETFRRAEDVELAYRLEARGLRFVFNADAIGYHYAERSFRSWLEIPYMYGRNDVIFFRDKEQSWLLGTVKEEFRYRNAFIKALVHFCVGRRAVNTQMQSGLKAAVVVGERLGSDHLVRAALSGVFNLRYYEGFSDELGGRKQFLAQVAQSGI